MYKRQGLGDVYKRQDQRIRSTDDLFKFSICRCRRCWSVERDAVFWSDEIEYQFWYPPLSDEEKCNITPDTYWVCPECFAIQMEIVKRRKKEKYYYFREYDIADTLYSIGIKKPEDIEAFLKEEAKFFDDEYYEAEDRSYRKQDLGG